MTISLQAPIILQESTDGLTPDGYTFNGTHAISGTTYCVPVPCAFSGTAAFQFTCPSTGTPSGTLIVQASNDRPAGESPDVTMVNWSTLSVWDEATAAWVQSKTVSGASSFVLTLPVVSVRYLRIKWSNTSGSVSPIIKLQTKG